MSYSNYEQKVVINGYELPGVQSVDGSYGISEKPVRVAGVGFIDAIVDQPLQGNFSINRKMVGYDPLLETDFNGKYRFDEEEINGAILYDDSSKGFSFNQARISRYSVTCSVGEIPDIQTDITVYGNLGKNGLEQTGTNSITQALGTFWGYSSWFFKPQNGTDRSIIQSRVRLLQGTNNSQGGGISHSFFGNIYLSLLYRNLEEMWFFLGEDPAADPGGSWFYTSRDVMGQVASPANGFTYLISESKALGPNGWIEWFSPGSLSVDYKAIFYNHSNQQYYGFRKDHTANLISNQSLPISSVPTVSIPTRIQTDNFLDYITEATPDIVYPNQSSIKVILDDFSIDAISDFSYTRTINTSPVYALPKGNAQNWIQGAPANSVNINPVQIDTQYPIETDINFSIIVDEYEIREIKDRVQAAPKISVEIQILDGKDQARVINSFKGRDVRLVSESLNSSTDGEMSISLTYKGYESYHNEI